MKISLSNASAHRLLSTLRMIDSNDTVKLSGLVRLDIARNINRLFPAMTTYEMETSALRRGLVPGDASHAANNEIIAKIEELGLAEQEYGLYEIEAGQLRLDDNPRITGDMVASLAPVLKDFDTSGAE